MIISTLSEKEKAQLFDIKQCDKEYYHGGQEKEVIICTDSI